VGVNKEVWSVDSLDYPRCGDSMKIVSFIVDQADTGASQFMAGEDSEGL
jgi:hypothetical protein